MSIDAPAAHRRLQPARAARRSLRYLLLLACGTALALAASCRPAAAADARFPPIDERLAAARAHRLDDLLATINALPAAERALTAAGHPDEERARRIDRLMGLRGRGLASVPESTAVAAGWLDLLRQDEALRAHPIGPRLADAADAALQLLLADPPHLRGRTNELLQTLRAQSPTHAEVWAVTHDRAFGAVVTPLPAASAASAAPLLLEGALTGPVPEETRWELPLDATATWIPDESGVLIQGRDRLYRLRLDDPAPPAPLGPLRPGAPLALSPGGDYAASVAPAGGRDSLSVLTLYRLAEHVDAIALGRGRAIVALAWVDDGTRLAALVDGTLRLYELALARPRQLALDIPAESGATARLVASPRGDRLIVADALPGVAGASSLRWRLRLIDPAGPTILDTRESDDPGPLTFTPGGHALLVTGGVDASSLLRLPLVGDRFGKPTPLPGLPSGESAHAAPVSLALAPDGDSMALMETAAPPVDAAPACIDLGLLGASDFLSLAAVTRITSAGDADPGAPGNRRASVAPGLSWHPTGRWLAVAHPLDADRQLLLLHDRRTGDAFPLGDGSGAAPAFSPQGRCLLWHEVDRFGRGAHRLVVRRLTPATPGADRARHWDAIAFDAYNTERPSDALSHYRNAVRLAPEIVTSRLGLARTYRLLAEPLSVGALAGWYLEGSARAAATAFERNDRSPEIQPEFYEAQFLRAALVGQRAADRLYAGVERELQSYDGPTLYAPAGQRALALMDRCVAALLWQPGSEALRVLYEGLATRAHLRESSAP